jgi:hypothetical protein
MVKNTSKSSKSQASNAGAKPAPPTYKILDKFPLVMSRPLCLIDGKGYASVCLPVSVQTTEVIDNSGNIIKLNPPEEKVDTKFCIVREDGVIFGLNYNNPLATLDFQIKLPDSPSMDKLWSPKGVREYSSGARPDPVIVFQKIVEVVDHFIDFTRSLSDQQTMCEFVACYILTTWFLDAFSVIGFLWPNGERGSGKTNLLIIVADLSYLGEFILAGGSYASLRDMADNGATLAFDDAENLADPKKSDPDKRALLLAGNRRGVYVTLKEPDGKKGWKTRHVNAYCPRAFSAINLPDAVLASRSIVVPLVRTADPNRANIDPAEHNSWPHDHRQLIDDLWALAIAHLVEMKKWDKWIGDHSPLIGRALQPWRAILAVAVWLEEQGVQGIWQRMENLSIKYQQERPEFEVSDFTNLVIHSIFECANRAISSVSANNNQTVIIELQISDVTNTAVSLSKLDDWDIDTQFITPRRVGRVVSQLRFERSSRPGGKGSRRLKSTVSELETLSRSYNISLPQHLAQYITNLQPPSVSNGSNGVNGTNGTVITARQISIDELTNSALYTDTSKPCYACGEINWVLRKDGITHYCGTCHPFINGDKNKD